MGAAALPPVRTIRVWMLAGRDERQIEALHGRLSAAAVDCFGWGLEEVRTVVAEVPAANWGIAGRPVVAEASE